jgi:hypothetical protein
MNPDRRATLKSTAVVVAFFITAKLLPAVRRFAKREQSQDPTQPKEHHHV